MGRRRRHSSNAERQKDYRLRQKQLQMLLAIDNPEPNSLPWLVQAAYYRQQFQNDPAQKAWLEEFRRTCREAAAQAMREIEAKG